MTVWAVLATGPSMNQAVADQVRGRCRVVAVSDAYRLAPWADALASTDAAWWDAHPQAQAFPGPKYCGSPPFLPVRGVARFPESMSGTNSGLLGCMVARHFGAQAILLCGFDLQGTHFFGPHGDGLFNSTRVQFDRMRKQFADWQPPDVEVVNCTPASALTTYPIMALDAALERFTDDTHHALGA